MVHRKRTWWMVLGLACGVFVGAGLILNGHIHLDVGFTGLRSLTIASWVAALVLLLQGVIYLTIAVRPTYRGTTWVPVIIASACLVSAVVVLDVLEFNVHLYSTWVLFLAATVPVSGFGLLVLIAAAILGLFRRAREKAHGRTRTG